MCHSTDLNEYSDIETHWIALFSLNNNDTYFDIFVVEYIPKETEKFFDKSIIVTSIFKIQACDSIMYRYFCIGCIYFMFAGKTF